MSFTAVALSDRQTAILRALRATGPADAATIAAEFQPGTDPRGTGQTLRRLRDGLGYVERLEDGRWRLTAAGRAKARRLS